MAVKKRGKKWHFKIRVFGKEVGVSTNARLKQDAEWIEKSLLTACRSGDYRSLDAVRGKSVSECSGIRDGNSRQVLHWIRNLRKI